MRETYNIFWFIKGKNWHRVKELCKLLFSRKNGYYTRFDTWNGFKEITWCKVFGHKIDYSKLGNLDSEQDLYCKNCQSYIKTLSYEEHKQLIRERKLERITK